MRYSICIINWNWLEILKLSLQALKTDVNVYDMEVLIVDNGSVDGSGDWLKTQVYPWLTSICNTDNVGSAVGRNQMIRQAKGDYILMLDSDICI